ncbi:T9SS type A sorting domain-containing protein [candidate division WOR-3 bacterium]|nr:T9SS type A sorting domain-containing protein [candidate division WOR-3 bacterium]
MKRCGLILMLAVFCFANLPPTIDYIDGEINYKPSSPPAWDRVLIDVAGDIRAIMWSGGKSIAVSANGDAIAVLYGAASANPDNPMAIKIGYSLDDGATWTTYGPFSGELRRIYPGIAGMPTFDTGYGELYYTWQESQLGYTTGDQKVMIEEGNPANSSPSVPQSLPNADVIFPWLLSIAVNPDDYQHVVATGWSYLLDGNQNLYCWVSEDGGYTWSDSINMTGAAISDAGVSGPVSFGTGDYVFYTYQDLYDIGGGVNIAYPYFIESTDGGYTWSAPEALPVPWAIATTSFWWHEIDGRVINDEPWTIQSDTENDSMWVFHATGSPGSWTWEVYNARVLGATSRWIDDTLYESEPSQYPSISYDDVSGMVLVSYKANFYVGDTLTWATHNGAHVGGIYSYDNGASWTIAAPLSTPNTGEIPWGEWSATECAHMLENDGGEVYAHIVWINGVDFNIYYEGGHTTGHVEEFVGIAEMGNNSVSSYNFSVAPTVASHYCTAAFTMPTSGNVALKLFDATGRLVRTAFNGQLDKGAQRIDINTSGLTNGAYFIILETTTGNSARKFIKL